MVLIFISTLLFTLVFSKNFFFWDTITEVSIPANFYYDTDFQQSFFNNATTTGHQTVIPFYLALVWKLFGRTLFVSHLALFPFVFGIFFLIYRLIRRSGLANPMLSLLFLLVILDPTLLSQGSLITFDVPQIFFFLLCIVSYSERKNLLFSVAFTGLCLTNLRGIFCGLGIIIYYLIDNYIMNRKIGVKIFLLFSPGIASVVIFLVLYLSSKNWSLVNYALSLLGEPSGLISFGKILTRIGIFGWRLIDYGRIGVFSVFGFLIYKVFRSKSLYDDFFKRTFLITISQLVVFFPVTVIFNKFIGHRYLLPIIVPGAICSGYWILKYSGFPKILFTVIGCLLVSGYFWIYPDKIAQGWDATPAHWPYYEVRTKMLTYFKKESIPVTDVGSYFPNQFSFKDTDLSQDNSSFKAADLRSDKYVLYSNVFNVPDEKLEVLKNPEIWTTMHKIKNRGIYMILLKRKEK